MIVPKGTYNVKVTDAKIKVNSLDKKYISLTLEIQDVGEYHQRKLFLPVVPGNNYSWMGAITAFFSDGDIQMYMLEYQDKDTMWVVCQLILGESGMVRVGISPSMYPNYHEYNYVKPCRTREVKHDDRV